MYTINVSADGYSSLGFVLNVSSDIAIGQTADVALSPVLPSDSFRFVVRCVCV